jgi:cellobiose phosphorylase
MPAPSEILSDPDIAQAYEDVRSDKSETAWMVLKYESAMKDNLKLAQTGTGDIAEMCEALGDEAAYGYVRVKLGNDEYSERTKFVFVVWLGEYSSRLYGCIHSYQSMCDRVNSVVLALTGLSNVVSSESYPR